MIFAMMSTQHGRALAAMIVGVGLSLAISQIAGVEPPELLELRTKFEKADDALKDPEKELNRKYVASLEALQARVRAAGELERTLAVTKELESYEGAQNPLVEDFPELRRVQEVHRRELLRVQRLYARDLVPLLKSYRDALTNLKAGLTRQNRLEAAIAVDTEIKGLEEGIRVQTVTNEPVPEERQGLRLEIAGASSVWKNEAVVLPGQTPIAISGTIELPSDVKSLRLRSASAYGSERLGFEFAGLKHEEGIENGSHRFYEVELREGTEKVGIKIGSQSVSNAWSWGPLQWSINEREWKDIPLRNLSH